MLSAPGQLVQSNDFHLIKAQPNHAAKPRCSGLPSIVWVMEKRRETCRETRREIGIQYM
jgi:hypothetical protein